MKEITIKVTGTSPILLHSDRLANPLDPNKKKIAPIASKRKKTDDDHLELARLEFAGSIYHDEKLGPYFPGRNIKAALIRSATKTKEGPKFRSGMVVLEDKCKLEYKGPREVDALFKDERFVDMRSVVVQRSRTMRCRPVFQEWELSFTACYDENVLEKEDIIRVAQTAGRLVGFGDYRPDNGGDFGRFEIVEAA